MIKDIEELKQQISKDIDTNSNLMINNVQNSLNNYYGNDWRKYVQLDSTKYYRKLICKERNFEMYIITWNKKQVSDIHDHSSNGCVYKILSGCLRENVYDDNLDLKYVKLINLHDCSSISNDIGFHSISNDKNEICVSIHVYSPPNHKTNYYKKSDK
jgi:predicted metal-dependent enzyme (double-stranded beta helix superfamily)